MFYKCYEKIKKREYSKYENKILVTNKTSYKKNKLQKKQVTKKTSYKQNKLQTKQVTKKTSYKKNKS